MVKFITFLYKFDERFVWGNDYNVVLPKATPVTGNY